VVSFPQVSPQCIRVVCLRIFFVTIYEFTYEVMYENCWTRQWATCTCTLSWWNWYITKPFRVSPYKQHLFNFMLYTNEPCNAILLWQPSSLLKSHSFAWRQSAQCSPLFQFAMSLFLCVSSSVCNSWCSFLTRVKRRCWQCWPSTWIFSVTNVLSLQEVL